jgi:hypothetical protein
MSPHRHVGFEKNGVMDFASINSRNSGRLSAEQFQENFETSTREVVQTHANALDSIPHNRECDSNEMHAND